MTEMNWSETYSKPLKIFACNVVLTQPLISFAAAVCSLAKKDKSL